MGSEYTTDIESVSERERLQDPSSRRVPAAASDPGCERPNNEDRYLVARSPVGTGYFVFDGMGGEPNGEAAAQVSSDTIKEFFSQQSNRDPQEALCASIEVAQQKLLATRTFPHRAGGMGTTVVAACITASRLAIAAVGDSRAYRVRAGTIEQLTSDHTIVQQLVDAGQLEAKDALVHPQAHVLTRCLGSAISFKIDCISFVIEASDSGEGADSLVLCSDGLYSMVSDEEIADVVSQMSPEVAVKQLVGMARARGGFDNITVVVIPVGGFLREEVRSTVEQTKRSPRNERSQPRPLGALRDVAPHSAGPALHAPDQTQQSPPAPSYRAHVRNSLVLSFVAVVVVTFSFVLLTMLQR